MKLSAIAAMGKKNEIGVGNSLPWRLPSDLKRFKEITMGKPVIMGDKTHESIGIVLPGRINIVISNDPAYQPREGAKLSGSLEEAIAEARATGADDTFVIGGAYTYAQALPVCDRLYLTRVGAEVESADKFFPDINLDEWVLVKRRRGDKTDKDEYEFDFEIYERK